MLLWANCLQIVLLKELHEPKQQIEMKHVYKINDYSLVKPAG